MLRNRWCPRREANAIGAALVLKRNIGIERDRPHQAVNSGGPRVVLRLCLGLLLLGRLLLHRNADAGRMRRGTALDRIGQLVILLRELKPADRCAGVGRGGRKVAAPSSLSPIVPRVGHDYSRHSNHTRSSGYVKKHDPMQKSLNAARAKQGGTLRSSAQDRFWTTPFDAASLAGRIGHSLGKFRYLLVWIEPARTLGSPDMRLGWTADRAVQTAEPEHHGWLAKSLGEEMRTASRAEAPEFARR